MWIRKRLDIGWTDLAAGLLNCCRPWQRSELQSAVERAWGPQTLACLSVRSGLDLLLASLRWPPGGEVLVSALTVPDVPRIIREHGLVPIPVDLDAATLGPNLYGLRRAITPATRGLVVAHLMGGRCDLAPFLQTAREHGLFVIEDCAQAFDHCYRGHPAADASLFSFGTIKTATALGGACLQVRDPQLLCDLRARQAAYPVQRRMTYLRRLLKYALLKGMSGRLASAALIECVRLLGRDYDRTFNGLVRGFGGDDFFPQIRRQPSASLWALLARRLRAYDARRIERRSALGRSLTDRIGGRFVIPGSSQRPHVHWVFPVLLANPPAAIARLREAGFDATQGSSLGVVPPPADRGELTARTAEQILRHTVYLPLYPELTERALTELAEALHRCGEPYAITSAASVPLTEELRRGDRERASVLRLTG